jgi:hypothetical protein
MIVTHVEIVVMKSLSELPAINMHFYSTLAEAEAMAEKLGVPVYYFQENHTWYVPVAK